MVHSAKYWVPIVPFALGTVVHNVYMYMYHKSSIKVLKGFFLLPTERRLGEELIEKWTSIYIAKHTFALLHTQDNSLSTSSCF